MPINADADPNKTEILIVDDEMLNIEVITMLLQNKNIPSSYALSGLDALRKIEERADLIQQSKSSGDKKHSMFKLILLDYCMPKMDGLETAQKIRELCIAQGVPQPHISCASAYDEPSFV